MNNEPLSTVQIQQYHLDAHPELCIEDNLGTDSRVMRAHVLSHDTIHRSSTDVLATHRAFIRHDSKKVAGVIANILS